MNLSTINLDVSGHVATLTLNHPGSRNSLSEATLREMVEALDRLRAHDDVRALILTGAGQAFCSGADLGKMDTVDVDGMSLGERAAATMDAVANPLILALQQFPLPVVAAVNGVAAGGGLALALAADIVIAARSAYFLSPFLPRLGIVPDMGATWFLPRKVGRARSIGLLLMGDRLPAEKAQEWGLIWACVDDAALMDEAGVLQDGWPRHRRIVPSKRVAHWTRLTARAWWLNSATNVTGSANCWTHPPSGRA